MIGETSAAFLSEVSSSKAVRTIMYTEPGYDETVWRRIVDEMAWTGAHVPEELGGLGLGFVELVIILEQMGASLLCSPFFSSVCLAQNAFLVAGSESQRSTYLKRLVQGEIGTLAFLGLGNQWNSNAVSASYKRKANSFVLEGDYRYVTDGHIADLFVVAARNVEKNGLSLFAIDARASGVSREWRPTLDQTRRQATIRLRDVNVSPDRLIGGLGEAAPILDVILDLAAICVAADQVGGAQRSLDLAVEFSLDRKQFGRQIGSFQAIKHKAADMMLKVEAARSALYYAACVADQVFANEADADSLREAASVAKSFCSDAYFFVAGNAMQIHGGVGFTEEYDIQLFLKRAKSTETFLGSAIWHRERLAKMILDE